MLFYTGIARTASAIAGSYVPNITSREKEILEITDMVDEGITILNSQQDIGKFGKLLDRAWQSKREMSAMVSNDHVDEIYRRAMTAGVVGGKLLGAGGGGFILLFAKPDIQPKVREALWDLIQVPFKFETSGSQIIFFDAEEDYSVEDKLRSSQSVADFRELVSREL